MQPFPTLDEVEAAIHDGGIVIANLERTFKSRLHGRYKDFMELLKQASRHRRFEEDARFPILFEVRSVIFDHAPYGITGTDLRKLFANRIPARKLTDWGTLVYRVAERDATTNRLVPRAT